MVGPTPIGGYGAALPRHWEPEPKQFCMTKLATEPKTFGWWSRSRKLKFWFPFHSPGSWSKRVVHIIQCFSVFNAQITLEPELKIF